MSTGIKVSGKGNKIHDNTVVGADVGYDIEGEDNSIKENKYFPLFPRLKPLVAAIKKPSANGSLKGLIVAAILSLIVGIVLLNYEWHFQPDSQSKNTQGQTQQPKENK